MQVMVAFRYKEDLEGIKMSGRIDEFQIAVGKLTNIVFDHFSDVPNVFCDVLDVSTQISGRDTFMYGFKDSSQQMNIFHYPPAQSSFLPMSCFLWKFFPENCKILLITLLKPDTFGEKLEEIFSSWVTYLQVTFFAIEEWKKILPIQSSDNVGFLLVH